MVEIKKEEIGRKILQIRKKYNMTQTELAEKLGISNKAVSAWEKGVSAPSMDTLYKICNCFRISTDYFTSDDDMKTVSDGMQSVRELYRVGFGPSSSHTMGPEKICRIFNDQNRQADKFEVTLYGSLAQTGVGHGTDNIVRKVLGENKTVVMFDETKTDLPHPNTMELKAYEKGKLVDNRFAYSIGGAEIKMDGVSLEETREIYPHKSFDEIKAHCKEKGIELWQYVEEVEGEGIWEFFAQIWQTMKECIGRGLKAEGILPGGLGVSRKAKQLFEKTHTQEGPEIKENRLVCAYAYAVGEENAAGGTIVTAPTCGASGVLPAVLYYYQNKKNYSDKMIFRALATASVVGNLIKTNASISGAECGCQAEIGSACSMAAAALCELYEMSIDQIEYAAEIAMEHHLGLTCDPVRGLVQIPCIERNAVAAMRAINAVNLSNILVDTRKISLDLVIKTMYETGRDLSGKYRETSVGGLAKLYEENV